MAGMPMEPGMAAVGETEQNGRVPLVEGGSRCDGQDGRNAGGTRDGESR